MLFMKMVILVGIGRILVGNMIIFEREDVWLDIMKF